MANTSTFFSKADQQIIDNLLQVGANRKRGEEQFFNTYSYFIQEGMRKYSVTEDEAFDAYADSILAAIEKITNRSFEGRSSLKTWLFQIFHNKCVDLLRKKTTNKNSIHQTVSVTEMLFELSDTAKSIVQRLVEEADMNQLNQLINELGAKCRELLLLFADSYNDKEIALALEYKSADVVKTSRLRCLEKLRLLYKKN
jgi:RNA polymerase sigma-70 factor (ECF subfamily)